MRESSSEHKKEYLDVMSIVGEESSPVHHDDNGPPPLSPIPRAGSKTASHSSNGPGIEPEDKGEENLQPQIITAAHDSLKVSSDDANDKSAFRITEVSPFTAADELEQSKGMSHEADSFVEVTKQRGQSESSESDETRTTLLVTARVPQPVREQESESNERVVPLEGTPNGPVAQQPVRRFRRVNKYERGRWVVEDTLEHRETDERPESEMRGALGAQTSGGVAGGVVGRESPFSQRRKGGGGGEGEDQLLHSRSSSDVGGGGGMGIEPSERGDHYHSDRTGSVTGGGGENLSRNTSMSSLTTAGDKSVNGDHSGDQMRNESESEMGYLPPQASAGYSTPVAAVSSPPQHPRHVVASFPSSSSYSVAVSVQQQQSMSTIPDSSTEETQPEQDSKTGVHRVEKALSHLNKELIRLVEENKEIIQLKDLNRSLEERNHRLKLERRQLEDEKRDLTADFTGRITNLQRSLEELSQQNKQLVIENKRLVHERQQLFQKGEQLTAELQSLRSSSASHS